MIQSLSASILKGMESFENMGHTIHHLAIPSSQDFLHFYHTISIEKGPLFDSSMADHTSSKWSFFSILPYCTITKKNNQAIELKQAEKITLSDDFFEIVNRAPFMETPCYPELEKFPFIGGWMGFLSYENFFETKQNLRIKNNKFPYYQFSFFNNVFLFEHATKKSYLITDGSQKPNEIYREYISNNKKTKIKRELKNKISVTPLISKENYYQKIETIFELIRSGAIYQANFTHKFEGMCAEEPFLIYESLREKNPAPFSCFYKINSKQYILCSSPERLFQLNNGTITASPIKGTIQRDKNSQIDEDLKNQLLNSTKDAAELAMIVDLIRNDIGKIATFGSVTVEAFKKLESFQKVHHLVGIVSGKIRKDVSPKEIFSALFPGGSITGAPKIRSIEILDQLEEEPRGPYTGSMGYIDVRGKMDFNIMIRTLLIDFQTISLQVGGGIVIDSNPEKEYNETIHKAQAMFDALSQNG